MSWDRVSDDGAENAVRMVQARAGERLTGKIFANAEGSALRKRDPALFAEFLQAHAQGTAAENIFVPADKLRELYQSNGWDWGGSVGSALRAFHA